MQNLKENQRMITNFNILSIYDEIFTSTTLKISFVEYKRC